MSQEDLNQLLELFRKLKQWRDEQMSAENESMIRSGAPMVNQEQIRIH